MRAVTLLMAALLLGTAPGAFSKTGSKTAPRPAAKHRVVAGKTVKPAPKTAAIAPLPDTAEIAQLRSAFRFAFPVYAVMATRDAQLGRARAMGLSNAVNMILPRLTLADASSREVTTPNNDTLYGSAWLDLAAGPVVLNVPAMAGRYNSAALMSVMTDNIAILGTRTGSQGGRYAIVGPDYTGNIPRDTQKIQMPSNDAWLLVRVLVNGPADVDAAAAALRGYSLESPEGRAAPVPTVATPAADAKSFLAVVNEALARSTGNPALVKKAQAFAAFGVGTGWDALPAETRALWTRSLPALRQELKGGIAAAGDVVDGWSYPRAGIGSPDADDDLRSYVALGGLAALPRVEAMYLSARTDKDGAALDGNKAYRVRIPAHMPIGAFWSLSMYQVEADGKLFFVANPLNRFAVGDRSPQVRADRDGSYEFFVQPSRPEGERVVNWLPAPRGKFVLVFRGYLPRAEMLDGRFRLPPVEVGEVVP